MASLKEMRDRIKSVETTQKITKAMLWREAILNLLLNFLLKLKPKKKLKLKP